MAIEKIGVYPKWLQAVPRDKNGKAIPKSQWLKKRRHHWVVRWYSSDSRKRYGKVFKRKAEAEKFASELQARFSLGDADRPRKITMRKFHLEHLQVMKGQVAYGTIQEHKRSLELFENFIGAQTILSKIQPRHAEAFIAEQLASNKVSTATVNKYIRNLRGIFNLAIELRGYLDEGQNPFARIKQRRITENKVRYVNLDEYWSLINAADDLWWKALLAIAYGSGLRRSEILYLTWSDVDFDQQRINVTAKKAGKKILAWEPKSRKNRVVPLSGQSVQLLVDMQVHAAEGHPYVFIPPDRLKAIMYRLEAGEWNTRKQPVYNISKNFHRVRCRAGVAKCTIHDLRRSAITNWAQKLPIQVVQQLAGHSNITTTRKYYLTVRDEDMVKAGKVLTEVLIQSDGN